MAKKGKEFEFAGVRVQIDPLILARRLITRQIPLLVAVALIGGAITAFSYKSAERRYLSKSSVLIRYEAYDETYLGKILNVAASYFGSDAEMIIILNELNLFESMRASRPYELAIGRLRDELIVRTSEQRIEVGYKSNMPRLAQRVVAFTTERLLNKMAELNEAPFNRELDAVESSLGDVEPRLKKAEQQLFEFKNRHPRIASELTILDGADSPSSLVDAAIREAERELAAARSGVVLKRKDITVSNTAAARKLVELQKLLIAAKTTYTENHPKVLRLEKDVLDQERVVRQERAAAQGDVPVGNSPAARKARTLAAQEKLRRLLKQKARDEASLIKRPELQQKWQKLSLQVSTLNSEVRELLGRRNEVRRERVLAANNFHGNFRLVDPATVPEVPVEPEIKKFAGMGMAATAAIGIVLALAREAFRQTFVNANELEESTGLQVFAVLPNITEDP